jgi:hypothetical protein
MAVWHQIYFSGNRQGEHNAVATCSGRTYTAQMHTHISERVGKPYLFVSDNDLLHIFWGAKTILSLGLLFQITKSGETLQTPFKLS